MEGRRCRLASRSLDRGSRIVVHLPRDPHAGLAAPPPLPVLYEDGDVIVIDKPPRIHVNETETSSGFSVVERLSAKCVFAVHRIDRDTSGVVLLAKNAQVAERLSRAFRERVAEKVYLAIVVGAVPDGVIDRPIGRDHRRPRARAVSGDGKAAVSRVKTLSAKGGLSALSVEPLTGRTHQIRVHLSSAGAPIFGDELYGAPRSVRIGAEVITAERVLLHAARLTIPLEDSRVRTFEAALPDDLAAFARFGLNFCSGLA